MESIFIERNITTEQAKQLRDYGVKVNFDKNQEIISQGQSVNNLFLIEEGYVKLLTFSEDGRTQVIGYCGELSWFGEFSYFSGGIETNYAVEAVTPVTCRIFNQQRMTLLCNNLVLMESIARSIVKKGSLAAQQIENISFLSSEQRILTVLQSMTSKFGIQQKNGVLVNFPLTKKDLADVSACSLEMVNRFMRKAREEGVITKLGRLLIINDLNKLFSHGTEGQNV